MASRAATQSSALAIRPAGAVAVALQQAGKDLGLNLLDMVAEGRANLVTPALMIDKVPSLYRLASRVITFDVEEETYPAPGKPGNVCLGAAALQKISNTVQVDWSGIRQVDDWDDPHRVKYQAEGTVLNLDGTRTNLAPGIVVLDMRGEPGWPIEKCGDEARAFLADAEAAAEKPPMTFEVPKGARGSTCRDCNAAIIWIDNPFKAGKKRPVDPNGTDHWRTCAAKAKAGADDAWPRILKARQFIDRLAATKAMNAAIRKLGVPSSMPKEKAAQPWIVMTLVFDPPAEDPVVRQMMVAHALGAMAALYGGPPVARPQLAGPRAVDEPVDAEEVESEPIDVSGMAEEADGVPGDDGPDPWDEPWDEPAAQPETSCPLPADLDQVPIHDERLRRYLDKINGYWEGLVARVGEREAAAVVQRHAPDGDPIKWPLEKIVDLGKAMAAKAREAA